MPYDPMLDMNNGAMMGRNTDDGANVGRNRPTKRQTLERLPSGQYLLDGTLVANRDWKPDPNETYTMVGKGGQKTVAQPPRQRGLLEGLGAIMARAVRP